MRAFSIKHEVVIGHSISTGDLNVNLDEKSVALAGVRVRLTRTEYQILELLSLRKGSALTRDMFRDLLYAGREAPELKIINVFICNLRRKLARASNGKDYIETVRGRGYMLRTPSDDAKSSG